MGLAALRDRVSVFRDTVACLLVVAGLARLLSLPHWSASSPDVLEVDQWA